jgi:cysteine desulfurase
MFYLDHCGTTPLASEVSDAMIDFIKLGVFGNPSAEHHDVGRKAFAAVEAARTEIAKAVGAQPTEVIFTSGAAEANNLIVWGFALRYRARGCRILYGATEHKSIFETALELANLEGVISEQVLVHADGTVNLEDLEQKLSANCDKPTLVCLMHINNEIPARHPVEKISELCKKYHAFFHCDGVQGFVRESLDFSEGHYGSYVISPHKIYGPKGAGILILGDNNLSTRLSVPYRGGNQEKGIRPGTVNTLAIVGAAKSISVHAEQRQKRVVHMSRCAEIFVKKLSDHLPDFRLTTPLNGNAPGIVNFYILGVDAPTILAANPELCINRGSSCIGAGGEQFSHVPKALGLPVEVQANVLRASFGQVISEHEALESACILIERLAKLRSMT